MAKRAAIERRGFFACVFGAFLAIFAKRSVRVPNVIDESVIGDVGGLCYEITVEYPKETLISGDIRNVPRGMEYVFYDQTGEVLQVDES